jgi:ketosteroid isomerase-like protein
MTPTETTEIGKKYVSLCKHGKFEACLQELFSKDAESVEAWTPPGVDRVTRGLAAIRAKGEAWVRDHEIHAIEVTGPFPLDQRFAVFFRFDVTNKPNQRRISMEEVGLFTIENGRITREEFFYDAS